MQRNGWLMVGLLALLGACSSTDFTPREKTVVRDAKTGALIPPYPCPDWSQDASVNYDNSVHSNYGCAVNNNMAVQLADPRDWTIGRGGSSGDGEASVRAVQRYRLGEIPEPLVPLQETQ